MLGCLRPAKQEDPTHFTVNGFSAGSCTGAVIALAIRCLWPASQITARLGAIATPKSVLAALVATAEPDRRNYYLVHAAEDCLCDWKPTDHELDMLQRPLHITYVEDSARWMGKRKHCYWHWLQCQLPTGKVSLTDLKLTHPDVVPRRDRIAAPMRLASWIRFETVSLASSWTSHQQLPGCRACMNSCNLASSPSSTVHMGSQAGKAYRLVLEEHGTCYSVLALLLGFVSPSRKRKGEESPSEKLRRLSSPRHWDVALVPFPEDFVPLPTPTETGLACPAPWAFPPSLRVLESRANKFRVLAMAEAGDTVTADHLLQMACLAAEHKPTVLGIPGQVPIPYQLECTVVLLQSLHALFQLLTTGSTSQHCPQAAGFAVALGTAARQDNGHIVSMASSLALALPWQ